MNMPQMNGDTLATELINIREDIPVILCTGFSRIISKEYSASIGIKSFAMKPLSQSELSSQIRNALDSK
jgi:DNA-binding NtrC family response regulator